MMALAADQVREFNDRGFLVLKGFFGKAAIGKISAWLDEMRRRPAHEGPEARYYEISPVMGESMLVRVEHFLGHQNLHLTQLLIPARAIDCLTELLGEPPVLFKEKVNYKLPSFRADKLHQDQSAGWNAYGDFFITMCIAVDENRKDNAALTFMKSGNYLRSLMAPEWQPLTQQDPPYSPPDEYVLVEADPGDVIFFDSYVPHGSPPNTGTRSRRNIYLTFNRRSAGDLRARYYADKWAIYPPNNPQQARDSDAYRV